jgi:hypothetical protein
VFVFTAHPMIGLFGQNRRPIDHTKVNVNGIDQQTLPSMVFVLTIQIQGYFPMDENVTTASILTVKH